MTATEFAVEPIRLDINSAAWQQWTLIRGIGPARARRIVAYRKQHGPWQTVDALRRIPELPAGWVDRAREHLRVGRPAAPAAPAGTPSSSLRERSADAE